MHGVIAFSSWNLRLNQPAYCLLGQLNALIIQQRELHQYLGIRRDRSRIDGDDDQPRFSPTDRKRPPTSIASPNLSANLRQLVGSQTGQGMKDKAASGQDIQNPGRETKLDRPFPQEKCGKTRFFAAGPFAASAQVLFNPLVPATNTFKHVDRRSPAILLQHKIKRFKRHLGIKRHAHSLRDSGDASAASWISSHIFFQVL